MPAAIETERLLLRGFRHSDAEAVFEYASDPETTEHMGWDTVRTRAESQAWLEGNIDNPSGGSAAYGITLQGATDVVLGAVGIGWATERDHVMELGYILNKRFWGNGYVPEAARALMVQAFAQTDVARIYAPVYADNEKSRRAAEKMGMTLDGVMRSARLVRGVRRDECIFSILRGEL